MVKKLGLPLAGALAVVIAIVLVNTLRFTPAPPPAYAPAVSVEIDAAAASERLARVIRLRTVSYQEPAEIDRDAFLALHSELEQAFPLVHATLLKEVVGGLSLLYTWPGSDAARKPLLLMAHQDVVPVLRGTEDAWTYPPFAGTVADGYVWGRGSLDDKAALTGILEAVELLLAEGFVPERTVYLAFGHDEEIGGFGGAKQIAGLLRERGVELYAVLDEGGFWTQGVLDGVSSPVALVGIAEKGYVTLELAVDGQGGHSSQPPPHTAVGVLSRAITRLEANPFPARLDGATAALFESVGPSLPFAQRLVFANLWLLRPLALSGMSAKPSSAAMIRTTTAATMVEGSEKENVLPIRATGLVNFRILPGDTPDTVEQRVRRVIDDPQVKIRALPNKNAPSTVSAVDHPAFRELERAIRQVSPEEVLVAPYLLVAQTDSRHFSGLSEAVYRYVGARIDERDLTGFHGTDERIGVESYAGAIRTYAQFLKNVAGPREGPE